MKQTLTLYDSCEMLTSLFWATENYNSLGLRSVASIVSWELTLSPISTAWLLYNMWTPPLLESPIV